MTPPAFAPPVHISSRPRTRTRARALSASTSAFHGVRAVRSARCRRVAQPVRMSAAARVEAAVGTRVVQWYRGVRGLSPAAVRAVRDVFGAGVEVVEEICFNVGIAGGVAEGVEGVVEWLLAETFDPQGLKSVSGFEGGVTVEVGPRLNFQTAWSANAVAICRACGAAGVERLERSRRYSLSAVDGSVIDVGKAKQFAAAVHDRMTEQVYEAPLCSFDSGLRPEPTYDVDVMGKGRSALLDVNANLGLGFDSQDIDYYLKLFEDMGRNPTNVELFDLAQSNSEHSRHWFFNGRIIIDGEEMPKHLLDVVRDTLRANPRNSVVAFADNSSTIRGATVPTLLPTTPGHPSKFELTQRDLDILFTAETHNFPSGVAPFPGAETGTGGRIRDTAATGIGSLVVAGTAGYSVGNLHIPGLDQPWEDEQFQYPTNLASPLRILINASNGASDYGNKFGEPVINGFARTYGVRTSNGDRREYVKPIMFSGGMGQMDHAHARKGKSEVGLWVVKVGGPAYRIGMGGGAASSMMQGDNRDDLDFNAVQRGDAEMAQKVYRVLRACVEMGKDNPIVSIHDQGAGGNCNVVKELIYPGGAKIDLRQVWVGDTSLSALEIWGAEYQEQFGLLLRAEEIDMFKELCARENVVPAFLGQIDGSGRIVLWDKEVKKAVVDMDLEAVLGDLPQKTFVDSRLPAAGVPLRLPADADFSAVLGRVLSLMTVGSKRFLTTKVDRSVTGLVAQQQCVGPLQLPLSDVAVLAQSHYTLRGSATGIGERPSLTSLSPGAMARVSVGEMMTNMAAVKVTAREDIKCEGNWMWAAKLNGDGASLYDAATAMRDVMIELGIAIDGGKDSLSMAARCPMGSDGADSETVRAPGTLVMSGYCTVENIELKLTPDIKSPGSSVILHIDIAKGKRRMGGSSVAQVYNQLGDVCPDVEDASVLCAAFDTMQSLIGHGPLAYHDVSDGGLVTAALEMAFAGNCGLDIAVDSKKLGVDTIAALFAEELGMLIEVPSDVVNSTSTAFEAAGVPCTVLATTRADKVVTVSDGGISAFKADMPSLRDMWEKTAFALEKLQANVACVTEEQTGLSSRSGLQYVVPWTPQPTETAVLNAAVKHKVAIVREEGSNGDREMTSAFHMAGFEAWDVSIKDIFAGRVDLTNFRGVVFVGGFSYADVLDSAKGWAGVMRFNESIRLQFDAFYARDDTFSLGICNGCQLMALLGRVPFSPTDIDGTAQPRFIHNKSSRFESRFSAVSIQEGSPAVMLRGMAGARLGVWVAHGEGQAYFPNESVLAQVREQKLAPIRYVDDSGSISGTYPFNPNGSTDGIAALCSADGRHLAMMPHPERSILKWQWAYLPSSDADRLPASPWITMFQNARKFCDDV